MIVDFCYLYIDAIGVPHICFSYKIIRRPDLKAVFVEQRHFSGAKKGVIGEMGGHQNSDSLIHQLFYLQQNPHLIAVIKVRSGFVQNKQLTSVWSDPDGSGSKPTGSFSIVDADQLVLRNFGNHIADSLHFLLAVGSKRLCSLLDP